MLSLRQRQELENKRMDEFRRKNEDAKRFAHHRTARESANAKEFHDVEEKRQEEAQKHAEIQRQLNESRREELDKQQDREILDKLNVQHLKQEDKELIDQIKNDRLRSRLQHEWNLQSSNFYKVVKDVNKPRPDDFVNGLYDSVLSMGSSELSKKIGVDIKDALGINVGTDPNKNVREHFNKTYSELLEKYPELQDGAMDPSVQMSGGKFKLVYKKRK